jgi:diguanylate cyclase (GGDEF)-like protein
MAAWLPAPPLEAGTETAWPPIRVLLVDDERHERERLERLLGLAEATRFEVAGVANVEAALQSLAAGGPEAVLVDQSLPGRDGLALIALAERRGFEVPMILMGTSSARRIDLEGLEIGIADYLDKAELTPARLERCLRFAVERQRRRQRLDRLTQFDALTGLANRSLYLDRLERAIASARRQGGHVAVMIMDLNGFKAVNDRLGHGAGDRLLQVVGDRLAGRLRQTDTAARLGGDEFAICAEHLARPEDAPLVARKLLEAVSPAIDLDGEAAFVTGSLGVALFPGDGDDAAGLLRLADAAMYRAKAEGGNRCRFHDERLDARLSEGTRAQSALRRALEADELTVHFQPQVSFGAAELGLAVWLHWRHPELGLVDAAQIRALAEDTGLVEPLTDWLIRTACGHAGEWQKAGFERVHVAVPVLSRRQLGWSRLADRVGAILAGTGLAPERLELEIPEALLMQEVAGGSAVLRALDALGVRLAVDGFGAGPMSLTLLNEAPIDTVKLSRRLVGGTPDDRRRTAVLRAVIRLCRELGLRVVADGPEGHAQLQLLRREGCHAVEALMSGPPLPAAACLTWLRHASGRT